MIIFFATFVFGVLLVLFLVVLVFFVLITIVLQKSDKGQIFYSVGWLVGWLVVTLLKKPQNCPISDFFNLTPKHYLHLKI